MKLNLKKINLEMRKRGMRTSDLANEWKVSWHVAYYARTKGGLSYLDRFSKLLKIEKAKLITGIDK